MISRLGVIAFLNTLPIYGGLAPLPDVQLHADAPAALNRALLAGELDLSPISSACYLRNRERLVLLDDLSVSSYGAVESVLLCAHTPVDTSFDPPVIPIPDDSETSVALLAWVLAQRTGRDLSPRFQVYPAAQMAEALADHGCALVIGDRALAMAIAPPAPVIVDLAQAWVDATGLPMVFAVWAARRDWADAHPALLTEITTALRANRDRFERDTAHRNRVLRQGSQRSTIPLADLTRYLTRCLDYHLTPDHRASLERFSAILSGAGVP